MHQPSHELQELCRRYDWDFPVPHPAKMNIILLLATSFLSAFALGYAKFFTLGYLCERIYSAADKTWVIQVVNAMMTIGPVAIYILSSPLSSACRKHRIMLVSGLVAALFFALGFHLPREDAAWLSLLFLGAIMGVFSVAKMACVPLEAKESGRSIVTINGGFTISFIVGLLAGLPAGAAAWNRLQERGVSLGILLLAVAGMLGSRARFRQEELRPMRESATDLIGDTLALGLKYPLHLLASPLIWGIAAAASLTMTVFVESRGLAGAELSSLVSLYAALGTIAGNLLSMRFERRGHQTSVLACAAFGLCILLIPHLVDGLLAQGWSPGAVYVFSAVWMCLSGTCFGLATNLIDSEFLLLSGRAGREGIGAAMQSAAVALFSFIIGGGIAAAWLMGIMDTSRQFLLLAALAIVGMSLMSILGLQQSAFDAILKRLTVFIVGLSLRLRYRIELRGVECIPRTGGVLLLPNHPAEIDPVILCSKIWHLRQPRPIVDESFYHMRGVHTIMKLMRALPMADLSQGAGSYKSLRIRQSLDEAARALQSDECVLMYPAGRLMRSGDEKLGAASGAAQLLKASPDSQVVLVRTRGLWGSSFSTALSGGATPQLGLCLKRAVLALLTNLLFFSPRRRVTLDFEIFAGSQSLSLNKAELNRRLEQHYNLGGTEPMNLVPMNLWTRRPPESSAPDHQPSRKLQSLPEAQIKKICGELATTFSLPPENVVPGRRLAEDLGMDSLTKAELISWLEDVHEVRGVEMDEITTVDDVVAATCRRKEEAVAQPNISPAPAGWLNPQPQDILIPDGQTLPEVFLKNCDRLGRAAAMADETTGILSFHALKLRVLLLSRVLADLPGERLAILLPASTTAAITIMAAWLAGKTPVMLNWTVGKRNLDHAIEKADVEVVLSSSRFLDRLRGVDLAGFADKLRTLEDLAREHIGTGEKISAALLARQDAATLYKKFHLARISAQQPAVILFTSGSESAPKGVPLSHENLLSNLRAAHAVMDFRPDDVLLGFLPPFHSFGFTVTTLLPLISGLRACYHPNPTEGRKLAECTRRYRATLLCGTPTFISHILKASAPGQLDSLRTLVAGAEKLPSELAEKVRALGHATIYEGYGITECSPVIALNRPGKPNRGVGQPLPCVSLKIVEPDTFKPVPAGIRGLILVRGTSIFSAYLGGSPNPFVEIDGERWYNTGDLGFLDPEGFLVLAGRMKRFIKVAGEMVSLPALEEALARHWPQGDDGPTLAIQALEPEGQRPRLWMFSLCELKVDEVNAKLRAAGFTGIAKMERVHTLKAIPLLGTGKIDYPALKKLMEFEAT